MNASTTIRWFGQKWSAPICRDAPEVPVPVGEPCIRCGKRFDASDRGITLPHYSLSGDRSWSLYHLDCYIKSLMPCDGCEVCNPTSMPAFQPCEECMGFGYIEDDGSGALGYTVKKACPKGCKEKPR